MSKRNIFHLAMALVLIIIPLSSQAQLKTIQRVDDPVVIECNDMAKLFGTPIDRLALFAVNQGTWSPIPFQVDQKKPDGSYAFTSGEQAEKDPDPNLDGNDELVFMIKDSGDKAKPEQLPESSEACIELTMTDPKDGTKGWLYLVSFPDSAPRSDMDYIQVKRDEANGYRSVTTYEYFIGGPSDRMYPDMLGRVNPDGSRGLDVLDRLKLRGVAEFPLGISVKFSMDEMTKSHNRAYIDGPVRILQLDEGYLELASFVKWEGAGNSLVSYYVNHMIWPITIKLPIPPNLPDWLKSILPEIKFNGYMDFNENVYQSYAFSAANPYNQAAILDGKMNDAEKNMDRETPIDWIGGFGPQGTLFSRVLLPPQLTDMWDKLTYYDDDQTRKDPSEDFPGVTAVGFHLTGPTPMTDHSEDENWQGDTFYIYLYYKSDLTPDNASDILDILDHPVTVTVNQVK